MFATTYHFTNDGHSIASEDFDAHCAWNGVGHGAEDGHGSEEEEGGPHGEAVDGLGVL